MREVEDFFGFSSQFLTLRIACLLSGRNDHDVLLGLWRGCKAVSKSGRLKHGQEATQFGWMFMMVFDDHGSYERDFALGHQIAKDTMFRTFRVELQKVDWPMDEIGEPLGGHADFGGGVGEA